VITVESTTSLVTIKILFKREGTGLIEASRLNQPRENFLRNFFAHVGVGFDQTGDIGEIFLPFAGPAGRIESRPDLEECQAATARTMPGPECVRPE